jgi:hypothetical protein
VEQIFLCTPFRVRSFIFIILPCCFKLRESPDI